MINNWTSLRYLCTAQIFSIDSKYMLNQTVNHIISYNLFEKLNLLTAIQNYKIRNNAQNVNIQTKINIKDFN